MSNPESRRRLVESLTARIRDLQNRLRGAQLTQAEGDILRREANGLIESITISARLPNDE